MTRGQRADAYLREHSLWRAAGRAVGPLLAVLAIDITVCWFMRRPTLVLPRAGVTDTAMARRVDLRENASRMAGVCHAWLRYGRNRNDSIVSYNYEHTDPISGRHETCMNWLVYAGETPFKDATEPVGLQASQNSNAPSAERSETPKP